MSETNSPVGTASLWTAIVGLIVALALGIVAAIFQSSASADIAMGCLLLFAVLQIVALGCGIAARRTPSGKAGMILSGVFLALGIPFSIVLFIR